jgi:hypothetical protein
MNKPSFIALYSARTGDELDRPGEVEGDAQLRKPQSEQIAAGLIEDYLRGQARPTNTPDCCCAVAP